MKPLFTSSAALLILALSSNAFASEEKSEILSPSHGSYSHPQPIALPPNPVRLQKFDLALQTIGIPLEPTPDYSEFPNQSALIQGDFTKRLPYIDPHSGLKRYLNITEPAVGLFKDFFNVALSKDSLEYLFHFSSNSEPNDNPALINHLTEISEQVKKPNSDKPLSGLKIVIDPGHMGGDEWDYATGKYVQIGGKDGKKVSEGDINLWTAYLAANALEDLGATVILTRDKPGSVSSKTIKTYDPAPFINQYFYDSLDDWMGKYLSLSDADLKSTILNAKEVKKGLSSNTVTSIERGQMFIEGEDLEARSQIVDEQHPDIMIDIHYDAQKLDELQGTNDTIDSFVAGGYLATETGSRKLRSYAMKHMLDVRRWNESVNLASELVQAMSKSEGVSLQKNEGFVTAPKIKDGVYARNLYITARNLSALMVYLECLHYDHTSEFKQMLLVNQTGHYHGTTFLYPKRLEAVAEGIKTGLLNYFKR